MLVSGRVRRLHVGSTSRTSRGVEYAEMAKACGLKGVKVSSVQELEEAGKTSG